MKPDIDRVRSTQRRCKAHTFSSYTADEVEFMLAMDNYKRENRRPYPTGAEVLHVLKSLGYRRVIHRKD